MNKILLCLVSLILSTNVLAQDNEVNVNSGNIEARSGQDHVTINGGNIEVRSATGENVVINGADGRSAGRMIGEMAKQASGFGLGVADAFKGQAANSASNGTATTATKVKVNKQGNNTRVQINKSANTASSNTVVSGTTTTVTSTAAATVNSKTSETNNKVVVAAPRGRMLPGIHDVNVAGFDGSAGSYASVSNVEIIKDGSVYSEDEDSINYSGTVRFKTSRGEDKELSGVINIQ